MTNSKSGEKKSSRTRHLGYVQIRRGLSEHLHSSRMSDRGAKLYLWLHLKCWFSGPRRGTVDTTYDDIRAGLGWTLKKVQRALGELQENGYVEVALARNQHESTVIRIVNYDGKEKGFAVDKSVQSKICAVDKDDHSDVHSSVHSSVHSKPRNYSERKGLPAPKNAVEGSRKEKKRTASAVRSRNDAGLLPSQPAFEKKGKLQERLAAKIASEDEPLASFLSHIRQSTGKPYPDWWGDVEAACGATGYTLDETSPYLSIGFVGVMTTVHDKHAGEGLRPGILCSKILDYCEREKILWPPSFQAHRNRLRSREREAEEVEAR